jgi:cell division control protein 6
MPSFKEILAGGGEGVFRDKSKLSPHYVPEHLLYRDKEIAKLMHALAPAVGGKKPRNVFVYGKTGTGKTSSTRQVAGELAKEGKELVSVSYLNCRVYDTRYKVLQKVLGENDSSLAKTGLSFAALYEKALDWVEETGKQVVFVLDELDMVKDLDSLVYTLTRANDDLKNGSISIIGISNKVNFKDRLDSRSRSSLCEEEVVFQPYDAQELKGILEERSKEALREGALSEGALNLVSAIAAQENGDARYALNLLLRSAEVTEEKKEKVIAEGDVEEARKRADEDKVVEVIDSLPEHQQMTLYAVALLATELKYKKLVEEGGEKFFFSGEVYERYAKEMKKSGREARTMRWYREFLNDLETLGLISTLQSGKGVRGQTTLIHLGYDAEKIRKLIEKKIV